MPDSKARRASLPAWFETPTGERYNTCRAITLDNWLLWRDALPDNPQHWKLLEVPQFETIVELAGRIHAMHQTLPDYRCLSDTPWTVSRWWDPFAEDGWDAGDHCLLRLAGYRVDQLPADWCDRSLGLVLRPVSTHWLECSLGVPSAPEPRPRSAARQAARSPRP